MVRGRRSAGKFVASGVAGSPGGTLFPPSGKFVASGVAGSPGGTLFPPSGKFVASGVAGSPRGTLFPPSGKFVASGVAGSPRGTLFPPSGKFVASGVAASPRGTFFPASAPGTRRSWTSPIGIPTIATLRPRPNRLRTQPRSRTCRHRRSYPRSTAHRPRTCSPMSPLRSRSSARRDRPKRWSSSSPASTSCWNASASQPGGQLGSPGVRGVRLDYDRAASRQRRRGVAAGDAERAGEVAPNTPSGPIGTSIRRRSSRGATGEPGSARSMIASTAVLAGVDTKFLA
jgi:hypothetical protein